MRESGVFETKYGRVLFTLIDPTIVHCSGNGEIGPPYRFKIRMYYKDGAWVIDPDPCFSYESIDGIRKTVIDDKGVLATEVLKVWSNFVTDDLIKRARIKSITARHTELEGEIERARASLADKEARLSKLTRELLFLLT